MPRTARITKIDRRGPRCTLVRWRGAGNERGEVEISGGIADFRDWIREQLKDADETLVAIALAQWLAENPTEAGDFSAIEGKLITLDLTADPSTGLLTVT
jgi:hypothetical protein